VYDTFGRVGLFVKGPIASGASYIQLGTSPFRELQKVTTTPTDPVDTASSKFADLLGFAIYSANPLRQDRQADPREIWHDLHPDVTLMALWEEADQTVSDFGEKLVLKSDTLMPVLRKIEANGYLTWRRDPADERHVRISLADTGRNTTPAEVSV
jgi:MarR family transcriptional regulator, organic hydroperoxide resistance regulator